MNTKYGGLYQVAFKQVTFSPPLPLSRSPRIPASGRLSRLLCLNATSYELSDGGAQPFANC
jgi:hypothetical protein